MGHSLITTSLATFIICMWLYSCLTIAKLALEAALSALLPASLVSECGHLRI